MVAKQVKQGVGKAPAVLLPRLPVDEAAAPAKILQKLGFGFAFAYENWPIPFAGKQIGGD